MAGNYYVLNRDDVRLLKDMARAYRAGKTSRRPTPQRRRNRGGGGRSRSIEYKMAVLFKDINAARVGTHGITTSSMVTDCIHLMVMPEINDPGLSMLDRFPADNLEPLLERNEENELVPVLLDAVNACWTTDIKAGDGAEQVDEGEAGTGVYNEPPVVVEGYIREYGETELVDPEDPEGPTHTVIKRYFVITDVINPLIMYEATLDTALSDTDESVVVTPTDDIWGKRPQGKRTAENLQGWAADEGAIATVVRGYDRDVLIQVECPAEEE